MRKGGGSDMLRRAREKQDKTTREGGGASSPMDQVRPSWQLPGNCTEEHNLLMPGNWRWSLDRILTLAPAFSYPKST